MNQPIFNFIYSFHMPEKNIYMFDMLKKVKFK